jgi:hypothetical protein
MTHPEPLDLDSFTVFPRTMPGVEHDRPVHLAGLVLTPKGPMLIAYLPIVTSENKGPTRGTWRLDV